MATVSLLDAIRFLKENGIAQVLRSGDDGKLEVRDAQAGFVLARMASPELVAFAEAKARAYGYSLQ